MLHRSAEKTNNGIKGWSISIKSVKDSLLHLAVY